MSEACIGLDVGSVRIGVAVCAAPGLPAVPLTTITRTNLARDLEAIVKLATDRGARTIVVGMPLQLSGSAGPAAEKIGAFVRKLQEKFAGPIVTVDERLTTAAAEKKLRDLPLSGSKRRRHVDEVAAVEILNSYLATRTST